MRKACAIFDIDGTLVDNRERVHAIMGAGSDYDTYQTWTPEKWDRFYADALFDRPIENMIECVRKLQVAPFFFTGRKEHGRGREKTWQWLQYHVWGLVTPFTAHPSCYRLFMRAEDDDRPSWQVKEDHLKTLLEMGAWDPIIAFDDSRADIEMYKRHGLVGCHVGGPPLK